MMEASANRESQDQRGCGGGGRQTGVAATFAFQLEGVAYSAGRERGLEPSGEAQAPNFDCG